MEDKLIVAALDAGVGGMIAAMIIFLAYKLAGKFLGGTNEALTRQAIAMEGLTDSIKEFVSRDNNEHKEILIMLKLIWTKIEKEGDGGPRAQA